MIGQYIQNYKIVAHLGEGGMGVVYKAEDNVLGREVALKMLHTSMIKQPQVLERFKKEAQVLARLLHPNIAVIYNFIEQDGQYFMVMEYVEGKNMDELAKLHQALPHKTIIAMFLQALEGLQHAHRKGIFHRDIKPSNLIVTPEGTVKLMDFGIAKIAGEQKLTQVNRVIGTVEFMAPEIIEGKDPSVASDIYATGITMYELLSGRLPFESASDYNLMQDIMKKKPVPLKAINPSVPAALNDIVMKALEKKPENRYTDARQMQQALLTAFPSYRDVDLSILSPAAKPIYETREESITQNYSTQLAASSPETRMEAPPTVIRQFEQMVLLNKRTPFILAGTGIIAVIIIFLFIRFSKHSETETQSVLVSKTDTPKKVTIAQEGGNIITVQPAAAQITPEPVHKNIPVQETPSPQKEAIEKKSSGKKLATKEIVKKEDAPVILPEVEEKKPFLPEKKVEKREITINDKLEVALLMRETITREEDEKEQAVSFSVASPVVYQGITIIRQGAIARGNIRIGRVVSSVSINSVTGANGREIALKGQNHRKVKKLATDRDYTAFVVRGIRISF